MTQVNLPPSFAIMRIAMAGFKAYDQKGIQVSTQERVDLHEIRMAVGDVTTTVEVEAIVPGTEVQVAATSAASAGPTSPAAPASPVAPVALADSAPPPDVAVTTEPGGIYLQLAAFSARENAESFRARAALELVSLDRPIEIYRKDGLFRLHVGPYRSRAEASAAAEQLKDSLDVRPHVVVR